MRRLVILRPQPGADESVRRARKLGLDAVAIPLFAVEPVPWSAPDASGFDGVLLTSANAVRHAGEELNGLRGLPVFAVGEATAQAARSAGFDIAANGTAGVDRLLGSIDAAFRLLHLRGEHRKAPEAPSQSIADIIVYRSVALPLPPAIGRLSGEVIAVHSKRAAHRLGELVDQPGALRVAAISKEVAAALGNGWAAVEAAATPDDDAVLALAAMLCETAAER